MKPRGMAKDTVTEADVFGTPDEPDNDHMMDPKPVKRKLPARHVKVTKLPAANQEAGGSGVGGFNAGSAKAVSAQGRQRQEATVNRKLNPGGEKDGNCSAETDVPAGKRHTVDSQAEEVIEIKDDDEDEMVISEVVNKKMRVEIEVKKQEIKTLKLQKHAAVEKVKKISSKVKAAHVSIAAEKEVLRQLKSEENSFKVKIEAFDTEIQLLQKKREVALQLKNEKRELAETRQVIITMKEDDATNWGRTLVEAKLEVKKIEQEIAGLPTAPGYNQDMLSLLNDQISTKRSELMCPVCFEESAPPIFSCTAQHLVCANCR